MKLTISEKLIVNNIIREIIRTLHKYGEDDYSTTTDFVYACDETDYKRLTILFNKLSD